MNTALSPSVDTPYDPSFYSGYAAESRTSAEIVVRELMDMFRPKSVVDVGCGIGTWLCAFAKNGVADLKGHDGAYVQEDQFLQPWSCFEALDLEHPRPRQPRSYDLALSMEVAEHLAPEHADGFVRFLCSCSDVVAFSAAVPRQGGTDHRNEQWQSWWARRFLAEGYAASDLIRRRIWRDTACAYYYRQNVVLYAKQSSPWISKLPEADWIHDERGLAYLDVIHPEKWEQAHDPKTLGLKRITQALPNALLMAARRRLP